MAFLGGFNWRIWVRQLVWFFPRQLSNRFQTSTEIFSGWWARATPLKNMSSSIGMISNPIYIYIWENKIDGNQTTNQILQTWYFVDHLLSPEALRVLRRAWPKFAPKLDGSAQNWWVNAGVMLVSSALVISVDVQKCIKFPKQVYIQCTPGSMHVRKSLQNKKQILQVNQ